MPNCRPTKTAADRGLLLRRPEAIGHHPQQSVGPGEFEGGAAGQDGVQEIGVELEPMELLRFVAGDFESMNEMCDRARLSEEAIYDLRPNQGGHGVLRIPI